jgi:uncharacterized membrane protein YheB (UPF0754 family)
VILSFPPLKIPESQSLKIPKSQSPNLPKSQPPNLTDRIKAYLQKYYPFETLFEREQAPRDELHFNQYRMQTSMRVVMVLLRISPWLCMVGFGGTFLTILISEHAAWLGNLGPQIADFYQANQGWLQAFNIVSISGLIGYGTNYIAIRMLFRPVIHRPIWGQGLIPSQKDRIIHTLAQGMHKHILSQELIRKRVEETGLVRKVNDLVMDGTVGLVQDQRLRYELKQFLYSVMEEWADRPAVRKEVVKIIDAQIEEKVEKGIERFIFETYKRYNRDQYEDAITKITEELPKVTMKVIERLESEMDTVAAFIRLNKVSTREQIMEVFIDLLNRVDITDLLAKQMAHFDEARLERMIWEATNEQLLYIQYLGTVLGILGGLLIWQPAIMGPAYVLVFGMLYGLDKLLFRIRQRRQAFKSQPVDQITEREAERSVS